MEALTAVSIAALNIYDMLKPIDDSLKIRDIILVEKRGGESDYFERLKRPLKAGVLVLSDSASRGLRKDTSGKWIESRLKELLIDVVEYKIIPDEKDILKKELIELSDNLKLDIIITTGGTGLSSRDSTPEATAEVIERSVPGLAEAMRSYGQKRTPFAMLSRNKAGIRKKTLIINLPGSLRAVEESMNCIFPAILHAQRMLWDEGHDD